MVVGTLITLGLVGYISISLYLGFFSRIPLEAGNRVVEDSTNVVDTVVGTNVNPNDLRDTIIIDKIMIDKHMGSRQYRVARKGIVSSTNVELYSGIVLSAYVHI